MRSVMTVILLFCVGCHESAAADPTGVFHGTWAEYDTYAVAGGSDEFTVAATDRPDVLDVGIFSDACRFEIRPLPDGSVDNDVAGIECQDPKGNMLALEHVHGSVSNDGIDLVVSGHANGPEGISEASVFFTAVRR